ncbi:dipeptidase PepE [Aliikangiella marina]|uniref:dipeptidase E n=1 Tax=Aliikangiella marina TaxID=1712262 RepID=A0A545T3A2_9GAMM|nr:dipeptidase PepE [Aliikangiella marina]TQV71665.1 dipeptidase PepE [Aliikangiella marina]TQV71680.1 dipeptidase PepE [Aliikangiella marina]
MKLLLLSSSRAGNTGYLAHANHLIKSHLNNEIEQLLFIPFAGVTVSYDQYAANVGGYFSQLGCHLTSIHNYKDQRVAIEEAQAIVVGGGNTFCLLESLYRLDLLMAIKQKISDNTPYIGWSAGSNICGPSIKTTNDMPIIQPPSFDALGVLPFQINPHYFDGSPPGHNGETREQRIAEFLVKNSSTKVIGLPEGSALERTQQQLTLVGENTAFLFSHKMGRQKIQPNTDLSYLLQNGYKK